MDSSLMKPEAHRVIPAAVSPAERAALERAWRDGGLDGHAGRVLAFIDRRREEILSRAGATPGAESLLNVIRAFIVETGSIDPHSEMRDQTRAIQDEIWIRGERGEYDRSHIAQEWTSRHAAAWRHWRVQTYLFVVDRLAAELVARLSPPGHSPESPQAPT